MIVKIVTKVDTDIKTVRIQLKVRDEGIYTFDDDTGAKVFELEGQYVPNALIPGQYGDYIDLNIDIETGQILNWPTDPYQGLQEIVDEHLNKDS